MTTIPSNVTMAPSVAPSVAPAAPARAPAAPARAPAGAPPLGNRLNRSRVLEGLFPLPSGGTPVQSFPVPRTLEEFKRLYPIHHTAPSKEALNSLFPTSSRRKRTQRKQKHRKN